MSDHEKGDSKETHDGFLNRWSSRKKEAIREESADSASSSAAGQTLDSYAGRSRPGRSRPDRSRPVLPTDEDSLTAKAQEPNAQIALPAESSVSGQDVVSLTDADMPALETLTDKSDVSAFFSKGVSAELRKAALRQVFRQPVYNLRDGLDDYDDDYTYFEPLGDTITSDMKFHIARKERARLEALREQSGCDPTDRGPTERGPTDLCTDDQCETTTLASGASKESDVSKVSDEQLAGYDKDLEAGENSDLIAMDKTAQLQQVDGEVIDSDSEITSQSPLKEIPNE